MLMYKLLVFDWDGTLMDSQQEIISCFQWASRDLGLPVPERDKIRNIIGLGMHEALMAMFPHFEDEKSRLPFIEQYRHYYFSPQKPPSELYGGVFEMLKKLEAAGYFLAVATGKGRRGLDGVLQRTGLDEVFHFTRCVDEAHSKPHPQMLQDVMDYLGALPAETLMIGDTEYDLQMASNAGVKSVAVACGAHDKTRLLAHNPLICLTETHELEDWLASNR